MPIVATQTPSGYWWVNGHSLAELALTSGVSRSMVGRVFGRERRPGMDVLRRLSSALGVTMEELAAFLGCPKDAPECPRNDPESEVKVVVAALLHGARRSR